MSTQAVSSGLGCVMKNTKKGVTIGGISECKSATCGKGGSKLLIIGIPIAVEIFCSLSEEIANRYNIFVIPRVVDIIKGAILELSETDLPSKLILANYYTQKAINHIPIPPAKQFLHPGIVTILEQTEKLLGKHPVIKVKILWAPGS
jgi:hypothetical protein